MNGFWQFVKEHRKVIIGVTIGIVAAVLMLTIGFWATLLIGVCAGLGAFFACKSEVKSAIIRWFDKILPKIFK